MMGLLLLKALQVMTILKPMNPEQATEFYLSIDSKLLIVMRVYTVTTE